MDSSNEKGTHYTLHQYGQDGVILVFTMFLLLIISILTIAFLYLQFIEVDLIASETKYLQTFYLASAGLEKGKRVMDDQARWGNIFPLLQNSPDKTYSDPNWVTPVDLDSHVSGTYTYRYVMDPNIQSSPYRIAIQGIGTINGTNRGVERTAKYELITGPAPIQIWPPGTEEFAKLHDDLENTVITARSYMNVQSGLLFIYTNPLQQKVLTNSSYLNNPTITPYDPKELTKSQKYAITIFNSQDKIAVSRQIDLNANEKLFYKNDNVGLHYANFTEGIDSAYYGKNWQYPEIYYKEKRNIQGGKTLIHPEMWVNKNKSITLKGGTTDTVLYYFDLLKLESGATITTEGNVKIYTKGLILEKGARLIGGSIANPNPLSLIILADYIPKEGFDSSRNMVSIGPSATVIGHIFAPNMSVYLNRGTSQSSSKNTRVVGSILANRLVTSGEPGQTGVIHVVDQGVNISRIEEDLGTWQEIRI